METTALLYNAIQNAVLSNLTLMLPFFRVLITVAARLLNPALWTFV